MPKKISNILSAIYYLVHIQISTIVSKFTSVANFYFPNHHIWLIYLFSLLAQRKAPAHTYFS